MMQLNEVTLISNSSKFLFYSKYILVQLLGFENLQTYNP